MSSRTRNKHLTIRLTPEEKEMVVRTASGESRTVADWARLTILAKCQELLHDAEAS